MGNLRSYFSRAIVFYLAILLFVFWAVDHKKIAVHAWPKTLSRLRADYSYLLAISNGAEPKKSQLVDGKRYFKAILRLYGQRPDANSFLGMSEYYLDNRSAAKDCFLKVKKDAPGFFWANYNLAVLMFAEKNYSLALDYAQQAVQAPLDKSVAFMMSSKVYQPLFVENGVTPQQLAQNMEEAKVFLIKSALTLRDGQVLSFKEPLPIRVF